MRNFTPLHDETEFYTKNRPAEGVASAGDFNRCLTNRSVNAIIAVQFRELDETQAERKSAFRYDFDL